MRALNPLILVLALGACGKPDAPPAQAAATPSPPPVAAAPAPAPEAVAEAAAASDAVAEPAWTAPPEATVAQDPPPESAPLPTPPPAETATVAEPAAQPAAPATAPVVVPPDAPYQVVDGRIDADTVEGWKIYRGIGTCATCHGPVGQGGVGPALVESLKEKISHELFVEVVANGRDGTMMKPFGENPNVMNNIDRIYAYLKARADGVLGPENLLKYPLGKIQ